MKAHHADPDLERMETEPAYNPGSDQGLVKAFRKRMQFIRNAPDERDFYKMRSLRFEKLKGNRSHQYSMRLNDQWRLIIEFEVLGVNKTAVIIGIEDYH
jgi:toxin HigB-1